MRWSSKISIIENEDVYQFFVTLIFKLNFLVKFSGNGLLLKDR